MILQGIVYRVRERDIFLEYNKKITFEVRHPHCVTQM